MSSLLLRLDALSKRYPNGTVALDRVDLEVRCRDFISLLGPSGCGKSTVLKLVAGLMPATDGRVVWSPSASLETRQQPISFVFQEPTLMPWATVFDNVWLPLRLRGQSREQAGEAVKGALARVGLDTFANVYPRELSGGMKMRVSIARATVTSPLLMLMDEPFAALDEMSRGRLNDDTLALWWAQGFSALFVTHSVYEAVYLSRRVVVMGARPGRVVGEVLIDEPYPRTEAFRSTPRYSAWCVQVSRMLRSDAGGA